MIDHSSRATALALILKDLRTARASYGQVMVAEPWGLELPYQAGVRFHLVVDGSCEIELPGGETLTLHAGDMALLPHGQPHRLRDGRRSPVVALTSVPAQEIGQAVYRLRSGGDGTPSLLVCCTVDFDHPAARRLLSEMPASLLLRAADIDGSGIAGLVSLMRDEMRRQRMGVATLLPRIADVIITWVIREWAETHDAPAVGWLAALRQPGIGQALAAIHREPDRKWTIPELAREAGMSRTRFALRFKEATGQSPARFLLEWRMTLAAGRLAQERIGLASLALELGYDSEASFIRAFRRVKDVTPARWRKQADSRIGAA